MPQHGYCMLPSEAIYRSTRHFCLLIFTIADKDLIPNLFVYFTFSM